MPGGPTSDPRKVGSDTCIASSEGENKAMKNKAMKIRLVVALGGGRWLLPCVTCPQSLNSGPLITA